MATKLIAPRPGEGVEELTVVTWLKKVGDHVDEFESVVELETDKVVTEFPSPIAGTLLRIDVQVGEAVKVGESMGLVGEPGEESAVESAPIAQQAQAETKVEKVTESQPEPQPVVQTPVSKETTEKQTEGGPAASAGFLSPLVRKMLEENHLEAAQIKGSGHDGRITKADVEAYLASPQPTKSTETVVKAQSAPAVATQPQDLEGQLIPHTSTRRQIAERMVNSVLTSPHVLTVMEADMSNVLAHRSRNKAEFAKAGINLTLTAYFIAAITEALKQHQMINASWTDEGLAVHKDINLGMAVALGDGGLIVPVIKKAQNLSLQGIAETVNDLAERARAKRLKTDEVRGGTFTLTNHGTGGSLFASPIINQPQLGILGTGTMQKRAIVLTDANGQDSIAIRPMIYLSLVFDHRAIDGESGDAFLRTVKQQIENWQ